MDQLESTTTTTTAFHSTLVEWVAHCTKVIGSIPEDDQKGHKYTCFARSALCIGNLYELYALVVIVVIESKDESLSEWVTRSPSELSWTAKKIKIVVKKNFWTFWDAKVLEKLGETSPEIVKWNLEYVTFVFQKKSFLLFVQLLSNSVSLLPNCCQRSF